MSLPIFYSEDLNISQQIITLDEDTSKHVVQVLRMSKGEQLQLTNGKGALVTAVIEDDHKKKCTVKNIGVKKTDAPVRKTPIAISILKNNARFEWFLEKATEIGITEITPLICERTEKLHFRFDRMKNILVSAMLQSQQLWLPQLHEPQKLNDIIQKSKQQQKFIAHCIDDEKNSLNKLVDRDATSQVILIGPEGDFSKTEIALALQHHFLPVTLGETRLRTETAGIVAATILQVS
jgi:16S rRNA (uracil1498-N3)-methyltransferase